MDFTLFPGDYPNARKTRKRAGASEGLFVGKIKQVDQWFLILYEDEDMEDFNEKMLCDGAKLYKKQIDARATVPDLALLKQLTAGYELVHPGEAVKEEVDA
jgi:hypothetical protein